MATNKAQNYEFPPVELLPPGTRIQNGLDEAQIRSKAEEILSELGEAGVAASLFQIHIGPVTSRYIFQFLASAPSLNVLREISLSIGAMEFESAANTWEHGGVDFTFSQQRTEAVRLYDLLCSPYWVSLRATLPIVLGSEFSGIPIVFDLASCSGLLIAGMRGSGKTSLIRSIVMSLLYAKSPKDLRVVTLSSKANELALIGQLPHSLIPLTPLSKFEPLMAWLRSEMEQRHQIFAKANVWDIRAFNTRGKTGPSAPTGDVADGIEIPEFLPNFLVILDEPFADLQFSSSVKDVLRRMLPDARSAGFFFVVASAETSHVIDISRMDSSCFAMAVHRTRSKSDSVALVNRNGAEEFSQRGMFFFAKPTPEPTDGSTGYIYVLANDSMPDVVKIGRTTDSPSQRAKELSSTGVPTPFRVAYEALVSDTVRAEKMVHHALKQNRRNAEREFFTVTVPDAIRAVLEVEREFPPGLQIRARSIKVLAPTDGAGLAEFREIAEYLKRNGPPQWLATPRQLGQETEPDNGCHEEDDEATGDECSDDVLFIKALEILRSSRRASTSMLQRSLRIGYNRAAHVMELMEAKGIVGPENASSPRKILKDLDEI